MSYPTERMSKGSGIIQQSFEYYLVLDFESTCQEGTKIDPQEIIEFPDKKFKMHCDLTYKKAPNYVKAFLLPQSVID